MSRPAILIIIFMGLCSGAAVPATARAADRIDRDVDRLSHRDLGKRIAARERVLAAGEEAVPALLKVIRGSKSDDPYRYQACLFLLGEIGSPEATRDLLRVAGDGSVSDRRRYWALASLAKIGAPEAVPLARERLRHDDGSTRQAAIYTILSQPPAVSVPILLEGLEATDVRERRSAAAGLRRLSGQNMRFDPDASGEERREAVERWKKWWADKEAFPPAPPAMPDMERHEEDGAVVWTDGGAERAKEIARKVVVLREAFAEWFEVSVGGAPTRVREFQEKRDFDRYGALNQWGFVIVSEFFYSSFLHEVVTFRTASAALDDRGLVHETFHDFFHRHSDVQLPWFNEGMAEYFETWRLEPDELATGPRNGEWRGAVRVKEGSLATGFLRKLLVAGQGEFYFGNRGVHYAWSWAIVDHLAGTDDGRAKLRRIFRLLRDGKKPEDISRKVFKKKDLGRLEEALRGEADGGGEEPESGPGGGDKP